MKKPLSEIDEEIRALYAQGLSDPEIGEELGLSKYIVCRRRLRMRLKSHKWVVGEYRDRVLEEMNARGCSDKEIAKVIGIHPTNVAQRRFRNVGVLSPFSPGRSHPYRPRPDQDYREDYAESVPADLDERVEAYRLLCCGESVDSVAFALGLSTQVAANYCREMPSWWANGYQDEDPTERIV